MKIFSKCSNLYHWAYACAFLLYLTMTKRLFIIIIHTPLNNLSTVLAVLELLCAFVVVPCPHFYLCPLLIYLLSSSSSTAQHNSIHIKTRGFAVYHYHYLLNTTTLHKQFTFLYTHGFFYFSRFCISYAQKCALQMMMISCTIILFKLN